MFGISSLLTFALATFTIASPTLVNRSTFEVRDGVDYTTFEHGRTGSKISYVTNSGICETTPGVNQYSGYISVGANTSMWFWFFEARNNASAAPLVVWLNGGPGCSSMTGVFQENGPCTFNNVSGSTPVLNPYSWNNFANMLYIDQPIGTGFSYGADNANSTHAAAEVLWKFMQTFYAQFPTYENRNFGLFTESYGGHYGPEFAFYFESQNARIAQGTVSGITIPLVALGINNGWMDPNVQYKSLIDYAVKNPYRALINESRANAFYKVYDEGCSPALSNCRISNSNKACAYAANLCEDQATYMVGDIDFDIYDIRQGIIPSFPPATYVDYLQNSEIQAQIGAQIQFQNCSNTVNNNFVYSGDFARSFVPALSKVVQSGIYVVIWAGDADWLCNTEGVQKVVSEIEFDQSAEFNSAPLVPYTVDGVPYGTYKTAGNFSFLNVFAAGHEVASFQPKLALQVFIQTMSQTTLYST